MSSIKIQKKHPETDGSGWLFRSTMIGTDSWLRTVRGFGKTETASSVAVSGQFKDRGHPDAPPPTVSDGQGGIREAIAGVHEKVP